MTQEEALKSHRLEEFEKPLLSSGSLLQAHYLLISIDIKLWVVGRHLESMPYSSFILETGQAWCFVPSHSWPRPSPWQCCPYVAICKRIAPIKERDGISGVLSELKIYGVSKGTFHKSLFQGTGIISPLERIL